MIGRFVERVRNLSTPVRFFISGLSLISLFPLLTIGTGLMSTGSTFAFYLGLGVLLLIVAVVLFILYPIVDSLLTDL